jgi:hypothetical protein
MVCPIKAKLLGRIIKKKNNGVGNWFKYELKSQSILKI